MANELLIILFASHMDATDNTGNFDICTTMLTLLSWSIAIRKFFHFIKSNETKKSDSELF